jgi:protein TonB
MSETMNPFLRPHEPHGTLRFVLSAVAALVLEALAVLALIPLVSHQGAPPGQPAPVKITIVAPPAPPPPPKAVPPPPKPVVPPPPLPVAPPIPMPPPPPHAVAHHITRRYVAPPKVVQPPPPPQVATPVTQVGVPNPSAPSEDDKAKLTAELRAAVQAAAREPASAMIANETGQPEVTLTYLDGRVTDISLTRSCGFPLLDQAALNAAQNASYPQPPPSLAGNTYRATVVVIFQGGQTNVDGD